MAAFSHFATACETLNRRVGKLVSRLSFVLIGLMLVTVFSRYLFGISYPWQMELVLSLHAIGFLTAMGYTLAEEAQVRVDVLYTHFSARRKAWVNLLGAVFLLFPFCGCIMFYSWVYVSNSWAIHEASPEYGGMEGIFVVKAFILAGPALLVLQGIAQIAQSLATLAGNKEQAHG